MRLEFSSLFQKVVDEVQVLTLFNDDEGPHILLIVGLLDWPSQVWKGPFGLDKSTATTGRQKSCRNRPGVQ